MLGLGYCDRIPKKAPSYRVDSVVFDAEKLLMSNSCEIKWAIDNNSLKNKK